MEPNTITLSEEVSVPVAAGAEMQSFFATGYTGSCSANGNRLYVLKNESALCVSPPLGQNIRRLRLSRSMTQRELARYLQVSMQAVSKWERGSAYPDLTLLIPIARLFSVTLDELFGL